MNFYFLDKERFKCLEENGMIYLDTLNSSEFKVSDYITFICLNLFPNVKENKLKARVMKSIKVNQHYRVFFRI